MWYIGSIILYCVSKLDCYHSLLCSVEIQTNGYCVNLPVFICVNLLTWHANINQLHVTIEPGAAALKLHATSHFCYVIPCVQPGRVLGQAGAHLRPTGRARPSRVLGQTKHDVCACHPSVVTAVARDAALFYLYFAHSTSILSSSLSPQH